MNKKKSILDSIIRNPNIPSPPGVALQVLDHASRPDCSIDKLSQLIAVDPAMSVKVLQMVNSAVFGLSRPATSIQRAVAILGIKSARSLVLSLSLPQMYKKSKPTEDMKTYWLRSVGGAIVARDLAKRMKVREPDDDMALALLRDIGAIILQQCMAEEYKQVVARPAEELFWDRCRWEEEFCGIDHAEVSAALLMEWHFPADASQAVRAHHNPEIGVFASPAAKDRAYALWFATMAAQLLVTPEQSSIYEKMRQVSQSKFGMDEQAMVKFLEPMSDRIKEFAAVMQVDIGRVDDFQTVLARASEELMYLTVSSNLDQQRTNEQKQQAETEAKKWREEALVDPLTKTYNRRYFLSKLREVFSADSSPGLRIGILFLDLDGFKVLNDKFGHRFGDQVLIEVASAIREQVRPKDVVARFGGDEFCVLFEAIDEDGCRAVAQRIWKAINGLTIRLDAQEGKVGVSIGALLASPTQSTLSGETLLETADQAMYRAKQSGKNRVYFLTWPLPCEVA